MLDKVKSLAGSLPLSKTQTPGQPIEQYLVALDIGTEFVKTLIGRVVGNDVEVIGLGRVHQGLNDMQAGAITDIAAVVNNCDQALSLAEQQAGVSARTAILGIAGELVKGTTTTVRFTRKEATKELDIEEVRRIIEIVQQKAEARARSALAWELGGKDVSVRLVNSALVSINIDGYKVTNPVGFQGKDVLVELYTAFAPMIHIGALERVAAELDLELLAIAAEPFAVARSVIGDDANAAMSAILMDVGGGTTDLAVVNEGGVEGTKMFGIGGRAFTRAIARELDVDFAQAETLKLNLGGEKVAKASSERADKALQKTLDVWISGVGLALTEFAALDHLPNRILLCGGGSSLQKLVERLQQSDWYRNLAFTKKPTIHHIDPDEVVGITDATGQITDHTLVTAMGLLRVGMDTLNTNGSMQAVSMKEKINKMLRV